jgi:hypothetical protein
MKIKKIPAQEIIFSAREIPIPCVADFFLRRESDF